MNTKVAYYASLGLFFCVFVSLQSFCWADSQAQTSRSDARSELRNLVLHESHEPLFGFEVHGATPGMGQFKFETKDLNNNYELSPLFVSTSIMPVQQVNGLAIGVLELSGGLQALLAQKNIADDRVSNLTFAFGPHLGPRYQLRLLENQWVVPTVAYQWSYWLSKDKFGINRQLSSSGSRVGLELFLNVLDRSSAGSLKADTGIKRTYMVIEYVSETGSNEFQTLQNKGYEVGLRLEI